ncbi:hypothetical protein GCM10009788_40710 [Nocardioides humi]|uniref:Acyltransferase 3 domain-containing protein n=2 Tax=Nocardioides humi TaxID=449461 RepID=A0ABN2B7E4_9ACTN
MDGLRGVTVVAVVLLHAELTAGPLPWLAAVNQALEPYRMPLLMTLSGMLLARSLSRGARRHLTGKVRAILWPYAVWTLLDVAHLAADALAAGEPLPPGLLRRLVYDPTSYLWFLAFLFCYHVLATPLPGRLRTAAGPALVLLGGALEPTDLSRFVTLAGWFLVGDLVARVVGPRVPPTMAGRIARVRWGVLASVGRQSIVYYACHLIVMVYAVRLAREAGVTDPRATVAVAVVVPLATGALLVRLRRHRWVDALFVWPRVESTAGTEQSGVAAPGVVPART